MTASPDLAAIGRKALSYVRPGDVVGLGTGRAASAFIEILAAEGPPVTGVPTSVASAELAERLGIPLKTLDECPELAVDIDGADEVDPEGNAIKGYGGALVREKIVAAAARKLVILIGEEKLVPKLGTRGKLPVEVIPFGREATARHLRRLGLVPELRMAGSLPLVTDNGNLIYDCGTRPIDEPAKLEAEIRAIPGVLGTGLFLGMATAVICQRGTDVEVQVFTR
jgi:ribose 5-phosphate isomerase A